MSVLIQHNVFRLDIPVQDPLTFPRVLQSICDLVHDLQNSGFIELIFTLPLDLCKIGAVDVFHNDIRIGIILPGIVNFDNIRVIQSVQKFRFPHDPPLFGIKLVLSRDQAGQIHGLQNIAHTAVFRGGTQINISHPALCEQLQDLVAIRNDFTGLELFF